MLIGGEWRKSNGVSLRIKIKIGPTWVSLSSMLPKTVGVGVQLFDNLLFQLCLLFHHHLNRLYYVHLFFGVLSFTKDSVRPPLTLYFTEFSLPPILTTSLSFAFVESVLTWVNFILTDYGWHNGQFWMSKSNLLQKGLVSSVE